MAELMAIVPKPKDAQPPHIKAIETKKQTVAANFFADNAVNLIRDSIIGTKAKEVKIRLKFHFSRRELQGSWLQATEMKRKITKTRGLYSLSHLPIDEADIPRRIDEAVDIVRKSLFCSFDGMAQLNTDVFDVEFFFCQATLTGDRISFNRTFSGNTNGRKGQDSE